mgnify:CR=1 FL=1
MSAQAMDKMRKIDFAKFAEDFRTLDPKDPGLWPLIPKIVILLALFAIILAAGWWFDWKDQLEEFAQKEQALSHELDIVSSCKQVVISIFLRTRFENAIG